MPPHDLWATTPAEPPEGDALRQQREAIRAKVEATDARRQALMAQARAAGWEAHLVGPAEFRFTKWGRTVDVVGDEATQAFVQQVTGGAA